MSISPIGLNSNYDKTSFGNVMLVKGKKWNGNILDSIVGIDSPSLNRLLEENDVVFRQVSKIIPDDAAKTGVKAYNVVISIIKDTSLFGHIMDFFHLIPRYKLADKYMPANSIIENMNEASISKIYDKFYKV
ncbi:hypothetical protein IKP85_04040 [bacterium]|nr:hypothetical protein [bacterium]